MREQEECQESAEDTQSRGNKKRILPGTITLESTRSAALDNRENVGTDKGAEFAYGGRDSVVLATDGGCRGFRSDEADVITWTELTEGKEDAVSY